MTGQFHTLMVIGFQGQAIQSLAGNPAQSGAEAGCWARPQRSLQSISLSLFSPVRQVKSLQRDDDVSASVRFVSVQSGWMCVRGAVWSKFSFFFQFILISLKLRQHLLGGRTRSDSVFEDLTLITGDKLIDLLKCVQDR